MTTALVLALAVLRSGIAGPLPSDPPQLIPVLTATALLCIVGLARHGHHTSFRLALIGAAFVVTIDLSGYARESRALVDADAWRILATTVSASALLAIGSAAAYATSRPRLRRRWLSVNTAAVVLGIVALAGWAVTNPGDSTLAAGSALGSLGAVTRSFIALTSVFTALGVIGDVLPAAERATTRGGSRGIAPGLPRNRGLTWARAFMDELSPGRQRARQAVLAERSRLARDIHADVVPGLRRVLRDAEHGRATEVIAGGLREVLADLEAAGGLAHPIQLEIGGLIPALEWLAERIERRSDVIVTIEVADAPEVAIGDVPGDVAAGAFRVAALALDNVVRHAPGSEATVSIGLSGRVVDMTVCDDGPGIPEGALADARAKGRRGLADIGAEAAACGATVSIERREPAGTCVVFTWRAAPVA